MKLSVLVAAFLFTSGLGVLSGQTLEVIPSHILTDEQAAIRAAGLQPNEHVTLQASLLDGANARWTSQAEFVADAQGTVDVPHQAPARGSYNEISAMGLIWSMKPEDKRIFRYSQPSDFAPQVIDFQLIRGGKPVANARLEQRTLAEGVRPIKIDGQLQGMFFVPAGSGPHPGVMVVGGSEGGLQTQKAAWLAARGFAALALAYFRYENLPADLQRIPLEYFGQALAWMRQRPEILPDRIGVMGTSRGGELALQLGSMYPHIVAVVAYVPANVRYAACCENMQAPAWTWQGQPLAYYIPHNRSFPNPMASQQAAIAVEHTHGPILLISGEDDGVWSSSLMTGAIVNRLKDSHFQFAVEHLNYAHAGHLAGRPEFVPDWHGGNAGGTARGDAESSADAIPKVLEFLHRNLDVNAPQ